MKYIIHMIRIFVSAFLIIVISCCNNWYNSLTSTCDSFNQFMIVQSNVVEWKYLCCYIYIIQMISYLVCNVMCVCVWQDDMTIWHDTMTWHDDTIDVKVVVLKYDKNVNKSTKCNKKRKMFWWKHWNEGGAGHFINRFANRRVASSIGGNTILLYLQYFFVTLGS